VTGSDYDDAGVRSQSEALSAVARHLEPTLSLPDNARMLTRFGHYASVVQLTDELAVAFCTDGVGSKTMIASALDRYDTIGFDCVAMNVNDLVCVGARPFAMVDYLGVHTLDDARTEQLLQGLGAAAKEAGIAIPGGEIAQLPEIIGAGDDRAFDLVGTALGTLAPRDLVLGRDLSPGDVLVGVSSSGIHSNGLTLARRVLLGGGSYGLEDEVPELGRTLGEELLEPTVIYVRAALGLWDAEIDTKGLVHITGDGFANLCRLEASTGYVIDDLPDPPPIFGLIERAGGISTAEMFRVFNMGVGFVVAVAEADADGALRTLAAGGYDARVIGRTSDETGVVRIPQRDLVGTLDRGESVFRTV
jgi:phosphoribosylformylglycinamidine cyclo-ligase